MSDISRFHHPPSILFIGNHLSQVTGVQSVSEAMALFLTTEGYQTWLTSIKPRRFARLLDVLVTIWSRRHDYDLALVEVFSGRAFYWAEAATILLDRARKPYILTLHGGNLPQYSQRHPHRMSRLLARAARVTVPSRYLLEKLQIYRNDLRLIYNPLDIEKYPFRLRANPDPTIAWLRAFHEIYNPSLVPLVLQHLLIKYPEAQITMFGPDKRDGSLKKMCLLADQIGVGNAVRIAGAIPKNQVPQQLSQFDIFLNTTNVDNAPVSVLEAMACGLCVVSTDAGGLPFLLENGSDSLLVPPDDALAMTQAVERLLSVPGLAHKISHNARLKAEHYDWKAVMPQWVELFHEVLDSSKSKL